LKNQIRTAKASSAARAKATVDGSPFFFVMTKIRNPIGSAAKKRSISSQELRHVAKRGSSKPLGRKKP
jgi:hypothetical protein